MNTNPYIKALECFREQHSELPTWMVTDHPFNCTRTHLRNSTPVWLSHYCSADTAIKIFENCIMWLTDIRKMNDESELLYAIDSLKSGLGRFSIDDPIYKGFPNIVLQDMNSLLGTSMELLEPVTDSIRNKIVMATCFSIHHDDANMWRLYGDNASGVEIRFNSEILSKTAGYYGHFVPNAGNYETGFVKVCYSGGSCECLQNLGNQVIEAYNETKSDDEKSMLRTIIYYSVSDFLMSHKHPCFKGEGEFRLFTHIPINKTWAGSDYLLNHPNGKTQYTPLAFGAHAIGYCGLEDFLPELIKSVNFGPHINKEQKEKLGQRLQELGLGEKIIQSTIPIRI